MSAEAPHRLRVLEYAEGVAGPVCGRLFAALGHDVVKIERPGGDPQRRLAPLFSTGEQSGEGIAFTYHALAKRLCTLDLRTADDADVFEALLADADVLVIDLLPDEAVRTGLTSEALRARHPALTVVSVTAFGSTGAESGIPGDSLLAEALGGLVSMVGEPGRAPLSLGGRQAEYSAGVAAFLGACVSLSTPRDGGAAPAVDVAAADVAAYFDWKSEASVRAGGVPPRRTGRGGRWKLFDTADGQIGLIYQPNQWGLVCSLIPIPELAEERFQTQAGRDRHDAEWSALVGAWLSDKPGAAIARRGQEMGLPLEVLATVADVTRSPQFAARGFLRPADDTDDRVRYPGSPAPALEWSMARPVAESRATLAWSPTDASRAPWWRTGTRERPLDGVVVLDMGQITAGAALSRILADFGARVIKVESPRQPDPMRIWGSEGGEVSPLFAPNNAGKEAVTLDLKSDRGRALFLQLAAQADVVVENFAAGVTDRLGVGYDGVSAVNDRIVYASLSGHGQQGPDARHKSYGSTLDLVSGAASVTGYPGHPVWSSFDLNYPDQLVSLHGAALIVHSLLARRTGLYLDISQAEVVSSTIGELIAAFLDGGAVPEPTGNRRHHAAPHDVYRTAGDDEWVALSVADDTHRRALAELVGGTTEDLDDLDDAITVWTRGRDKHAAAAALRDAGVPAVPVLTALERYREPRFQHRGVYTPPGDPSVKALPFLMTPAVQGLPGPAPDLGRDTRRILAELCGVGPDEYAALAEDGVV